MRLVFAGLAAMVVAGCATGVPTGGQVVNESYGVSSIGWDSGTRIYVFVGAHEVEGKVAICGLYTIGGDTAFTSRFNREVMAATSVDIDGERMLHGLGHLSEITFLGTKFGDYVGQPTVCRLTDTPWRPELRDAVPDISVPQMRFTG